MTTKTPQEIARERNHIIELAKKCDGIIYPTDEVAFDMPDLQAFAQQIRNEALKDAVDKLKSKHDYECSAAAHHSGSWQPAYDYHMNRQAAVSECKDAILAMIKE